MTTEGAVATVYVQNLEERVKPDVLKETLRHVFSEYGTIIDIVAKTNLKSKGQAFVVFEAPESAAAAVEEVHGFPIFDKPMRLALAKTRSDASVKLLGNENEFEQHKRHRIAERDKVMLNYGCWGDATDKRRAIEAVEEQKRLKRPRQTAGQAETPAGTTAGMNTLGSALKTTGQSAQGSAVPDEYLPPNKILFVQNFPADYDAAALTGIFGRFEGFQEVRLVPGRKGIAFVEYATEQGAITAKENTAGMAFGQDHVIKVTYQRQ